MKKFLYILFVFVSCNVACYEYVYSQPPTISFGGSSQTASAGAVVNVLSATYTAGNTYVFFLATYRSGAVPSDNPTVASGGLTLVKRGTVAGDYNNRMIVYTATVTSTETTAITFTYAETQATKIYTNFSMPTTAGLTFEAVGTNGTTANPSLTLTARSNVSTAAMFTNNSNPFTGTAEAGWTEDADFGSSVPIGYYGTHRNAHSDNTPSVTAAASNWTGLALQVHSLTRRVISSN